MIKHLVTNKVETHTYRNITNGKVESEFDIVFKNNIFSHVRMGDSMIHGLDEWEKYGHIDREIVRLIHENK